MNIEVMGRLLHHSEQSHLLQGQNCRFLKSPPILAVFLLKMWLSSRIFFDPFIFTHWPMCTVQWLSGLALCFAPLYGRFRPCTAKIHAFEHKLEKSKISPYRTAFFLFLLRMGFFFLHISSEMWKKNAVQAMARLKFPARFGSQLANKIRERLFVFVIIQV